MYKAKLYVDVQINDGYFKCQLSTDNWENWRTSKTTTHTSKTLNYRQSVLINLSNERLPYFGRQV